jgi:predicted alpha/beta-hydrolase family hydrolase
MPMQRSATWTVRVGEHTVSAAFDPATTDEAIATFLFAHGAGGSMGDRGVLALSAELRKRGLHVVRFNFPYRERGSRRPDPMPLLQACIVAVEAHARQQIDAPFWILGGRSMGGRAASMLVAGGNACDGLLLLAYPLHPAGQPEKLRGAHLPRIAAPTLCLNGTKDALCEPDLMDPVVARLSANWTMHWLADADHSFHVTKASGRTDADVRDEIGNLTIAWVESIKNPPAADRRTPR